MSQTGNVPATSSIEPTLKVVPPVVRFKAHVVSVSGVKGKSVPPKFTPTVKAVRQMPSGSRRAGFLSAFCVDV